MPKSSNKDIFILLKPFGKHKKGAQFNCMNGLIYGLIQEVDGKHQMISFADPTWFKYKKPRYERAKWIDAEGIVYYIDEIDNINLLKKICKNLIEQVANAPRRGQIW